MERIEISSVTCPTHPAILDEIEEVRPHDELQRKRVGQPGGPGTSRPRLRRATGRASTGTSASAAGAARSGGGSGAGGGRGGTDVNRRRHVTSTGDVIAGGLGSRKWQGRARLPVCAAT